MPHCQQNKGGHAEELREMMGYGGWEIMGPGMAGMAVFWIGVVFLVVWAAARLFSSDNRSTKETALDILERLYGSGEITAAEHQQARKELA